VLNVRIRQETRSTPSTDQPEDTVEPNETVTWSVETPTVSM